MSEKDKPARAMTIRIGDEVYTDVKDFCILIRDKDDMITSQASSDSWAVGACEDLMIQIDARRRRAAEDQE